MITHPRNDAEATVESQTTRESATESTPADAATAQDSHAPIAHTQSSAAKISSSARLIATRAATGAQGWWAAIRRREARAWAGSGIVVLVLVALITAILAGMGGQASASAAVPQIQVPPHQTYNAAPPSTPSGDSVNISLDIKEGLISIAPNVAYHAWTFNGTVPGPILRVRQGQTVNFTLKNDGTMGHSIDFHAAQTAPNVNYRTIAPHETLNFSWRADYPGIFMYHCGTSPAMEHMANGMYGAIIVDPANGWSPAQEYVLVQSEFYTHKNADGSYALDQSKLMQTMPDYVVFNGYAFQYQSQPLTAKVNQKIRLFVLNAGPSEFSAFHVVGAIFSDYYPDGNPSNHLQGDQTIMVPPGGGSVVELTIPNAGRYPFVTHSFSGASSGATGVLEVSQ